MVCLQAVSVPALLVLRYCFGLIVSAFKRSLGQRYSVAVFACALSHARICSFTLLSIRGVFM